MSNEITRAASPTCTPWTIAAADGQTRSEHVTGQSTGSGDGEAGPQLAARYDRDGLAVSATAHREAQPNGGALSLVVGNARLGRQNEAALTLARLSTPTQNGTACNIDILGAQINHGALNQDGSVGLNAGLMLTGAGAECTKTFRAGHSVTWGLSASMGTAASLGARDADGDGRPEVCGRVSASALTLGACLELPFGDD